MRTSQCRSTIVTAVTPTAVIPTAIATCLACSVGLFSALWDGNRGAEGDQKSCVQSSDQTAEFVCITCLLSPRGRFFLPSFLPCFPSKRLLVVITPPRNMTCAAVFWRGLEGVCVCVCVCVCTAREKKERARARVLGWELLPFVCIRSFCTCCN